MVIRALSRPLNKGGETVNYVSDFLAKLIKACEKDIDEEEK